MFLPRLLAVGALLVAVILAAVFGALALTEGDAEVKLPVAMVVPEESGMNRMILSVFESIELTDASLDLRYADEQEALRMVRNGDVIAALIIPPNFVQDIMSGKNTPATVTMRDNAGVESLLFRETAEAGGLLLKSSQCGVYAVHGAALAAGKKDEQVNKILEEANTKFITLALSQGAMISGKNVSSSDGLSMAEYFSSSGILLFALLLGTAITGLIRRDNGEFYRCLARKGVTSPAIATAKLCGTFVIQFVFAAAMAVLLGIAFSLGLGPENFVQMLPALLAVAAFQLFLTFAVDSPMAGVLLQFGAGVFLLFMAGGIVPREFLPGAFADISAFLPVTPMLEQIRHAMAGTAQALMGCLIWSALLFTGSVFLVERNIRKA